MHKGINFPRESFTPRRIRDRPRLMMPIGDMRDGKRSGVTWHR